MAGRTKVFFGCGNAASFLTRMTFNTLLQAMLGCANTFAHRFIALMLEQNHVVLTHELRIFHTFLTLTLFQLGQINTRRRRECCNNKGCCNTQGGEA
jgi:hypothetical protein